MSDFNDFLKGIDNKTLAEGIRRAQEYSKTEEGKKMISKLKSGESIKGVDRKALENAFRKNPEFLKKINDILK